MNHSSGRRGLRVLTLVLAAACGLTVANLYYAQPLLDLIAGAFDISQGAATLVVTLTQVGYALGLLFVLPLGDLVENRRLVTRVLVGTAAALLLAATAPVFGVFAAVGVLVGITSVVAQILVPLAAHLAPPEQRGSFVGKVMSGLLLGILLARTVSSLVADRLGWRAIYFVSAGVMVVLLVALRRLLPPHVPEHRTTYRALLGSVLGLVRSEPILRARALSQGCMFGAFSVFWTAIAYELIDEHGLSQNGIALFALVGAGGAAAAPIGGWLADRGRGRAGSGLMLLLVLRSACARRPGPPKRPAARRCRSTARSRGPVPPGDEPARDIRARACGAGTDQHRVHDDGVRQRCDRVSGDRSAARCLRLDRDLLVRGGPAAGGIRHVGVVAPSVAGAGTSGARGRRGPLIVDPATHPAPSRRSLEMPVEPFDDGCESSHPMRR